MTNLPKEPIAGSELPGAERTAVAGQFPKIIPCAIHIARENAMREDRFHFNRGAIRPMQCLADGWRLIKSDYWFFVGVTFVGILVAELAPMGILMGPAMCGIHICLLRQA